MTLVVGTSGWQYRDWRGVLYPQGVPQRLWLEQYATAFATVEINNAFYRLPSAETFAAWRARTPAGFRIAVKASRFLTHIKRLRDPEEPVRRLMGRAENLGDRLGPILLQLPPTLRADPPLLNDCLHCFPAGTRVAVEPRHESWWTDDTRAVLEHNGAALCWADADERPVTPLWRTTDWGYLRLHHGTAEPRPRYHGPVLTEWVHRVAEAWPESCEVDIYFNNDPGGAAIYDAAQFARTAAAIGARVTRTPDIRASTRSS
ncbi:DUF72 domain-containing protein [Nocardia cyriacigeorgica]|uniref:DUF72 domain-containing protein n=1 Tax=Nocardia cyriacigeorgica TaxID=135487 RepID=A0A6P1D6F1_9NOCA|nr:DUF72 domain-containing protein [Nocardia cyriacigeorgica]NEW37760.1 DUF72 domain-containing protein [Nocardia cyriacigeorgica]NEW45638.1 DUF72 domain-containing protein [Nocardia cyriacigeorgica]NEW48855.1 DUF72 domain-containing protein [Nocardia cyriacigeorgica]NEW56142.1 DUF72 domain-containing protein [Nocardia cyriacigeorgica]